MTYCLALKVRDGLVFAADSRTTAGVDYVSTYRKLHIFPAPDRLVVVLTSGNLATTQEVLDDLRRDLAAGDGRDSLGTSTFLFEAARYVGTVLSEVVRKYAAALNGSGADARATLIVGGQIKGQPPELYLVYPEGNYVAATDETPFLQLGEFKYGKPILSRIATIGLSLDDAARLALVSFDAAMKSNLSVGPPVQVAVYRDGALNFEHHLVLDADSKFFRTFCDRWNQQLTSAFQHLPKFEWERSGAA